MTFRKIRFLPLLSFVLCIHCLFSCTAKPGPVSPPAPVITQTAVQKTIPVQIQAIGNVEPYQTISVKTQLSGQITTISVKEGQDIKKGALLLQLDARPYEMALKQAEANLARDTAQAKNAQVEAQRYTALLEKGYISKEQYDQIQTNWTSLEATIRADKAALESARVQLQYCYVYSPIDGRIGAIKVHQGNEIKASETEIAVINQIEPIKAVFSVPEKSLSDVFHYMKTKKIKVDAFLPNDLQPEAGVLSFVDNAVNQATGTITLKAVFANKSRRLWPGQFLNIVLTLTEKPGAILVPTQSVNTGQNGLYVFVVKSDSTVELRMIKTGMKLQNEIEILEGIKTGERVVTDGQIRLKPGSKVVLRNPSAPAGK